MTHLEQVKTYPPRSTILSVIRWRLHEFWSDKTHMSYKFLTRIRKSPLIQNKTFLRLLGFKDHKCTSLDWLRSVAPCIEISLETNFSLSNILLQMMVLCVQIHSKLSLSQRYYIQDRKWYRCYKYEKSRNLSLSVKYKATDEWSNYLKTQLGIQ